MRTAARTAVVAGTATAVSGRVRRRQDARYQQQADTQAYEQQQQQEGERAHRHHILCRSPIVKPSVFSTEPS